MEKINLREERDFGQKINATFLFLQQNFGSLFKNLLYYAGPLALLAGVFMGLYQSNYGFNSESVPSGKEGLEFVFSNFLNVNNILAITLSILGRVAVIGVTFAYLAEYLESPDAKVSMEAVWSRIRHNFLRLFFSVLVYILAVTFAAFILTLVSFFLFFRFGAVPMNMEAILPNFFSVLLMGLIMLVPLTFFAVKFCMFPGVIFVEDKGLVSSFGRSWKLTRGKWWSSFGLVIIVSIIVAIIGVAFQIPLLLIAFFKEMLQWEGGGSNQMIIILASVIGILGETMLYSIVNLALGFQYFNLVERQESIGLMQEIDSLGQRSTFNSNEGDY